MPILLAMVCTLIFRELSYANETYIYVDKWGRQHWSNVPPPPELLSKPEERPSEPEPKAEAPEPPEKKAEELKPKTPEQKAEKPTTIAPEEPVLVYPPRVPPTKLPANVYELKALAYRIAVEEGVDPELVDAVIEQESNYEPRAESQKQAQGLMQLIPATQERFGVSNPWDPEENIRGGVRYLRFLLEMFNNNIAYALASYNAGEENVIKYRGIPPFPETRNYVREVMARYSGEFVGIIPARARRFGRIRERPRYRYREIPYRVVIDVPGLYALLP